MKNITSEITLYRESIRHLWNSSFSLLDESLRHGECLEIFERIDELLFRAIVCEPLKMTIDRTARLEPISRIRIIPISPGLVPILINRSTPATGYWDDPTKTIHSIETKFAFIGFFDWDEYNVKDCAYYRVRITNCDSKPSKIGRDALIETSYANIYLADND